MLCRTTGWDYKERNKKQEMEQIFETDNSVPEEDVAPEVLTVYL